MTQGLLTPLQLTAGAALLQNTGLRVYPSALDSYNNYFLIFAWQAAVNYYVAQPWSTPGTLTQLLTIGNSTCAALGNSIPTGAPTPRPITGPVNTGFSGLINDTGNLYLGDGDIGKFAQAFAAAQGYITTTNIFINSAVNAQTYLGPTFTGMDALITNNLSAVNSNFTGFGVDLANQGQLTDLSNIDVYGTPAALLQQIVKVADLQGAMLSGVQTQLLAAGLTKDNIKTLINQGPTVTANEFDQYQRIAYTGMTNVVGSALQTVLDILDVTTPNINTMADLLNQQKIFPNSWPTLTTPSPAGPIPVYLNNGSVNMSIEPVVNAYLPTATGCEDLGKVIPPGQAVANKAVQTSLQQITGIVNTTLPQLAETVLGTTANAWNINREYLGNAVVSTGTPIPSFYRAQQDVPAGTNINNTNYWQSTSLGGLSTTAGLPDIQSQTTAITQDVADYYINTLATGTGPNGTLTMGDVLGAAAGYGYTDNLNSVIVNFQTLNSAGALTALYTVYQNMLSASNDAAMLLLIGQANTAITTIVLNYGSITSAINTAWSAMATKLNKEYGYQTNADIVWADLLANNRNSVYGFIQSLPSYGTDVSAGGTAWYLNQIADTSIAGGQAVIGTMREATNNQRLAATQLSVDTKPSSTPAITSAPVVVPVY